MEISPIAGIRVMPSWKERPVDTELPALYDVESAARPGDDAYTPHGKKAAGAEENEEEQAEGAEESGAPEASAGPGEKPASQISFFA